VVGVELDDEPATGIGTRGDQMRAHDAARAMIKTCGRCSAPAAAPASIPIAAAVRRHAGNARCRPARSGATCNPRLRASRALRREDHRAPRADRDARVVVQAPKVRVLASASITTIMAWTARWTI
jgi:hypothetical protein